MKLRLWSEQEIAIVRDLYPDTPTKQIADLLGRSIGQVYECAYRIGIKKSAAYMAGPFGCRLRRDDNPGIATRFKPGHKSWNGGLTYNPGGRSVDTQFKKGQPRMGKAAENYQPIGTERITREGYLQRKVNDDMPMHKRWRFVHVINWEAVNGPVPPGMLLVFRNGDRLDARPENLELVTRRELMLRNTVQRYGKEVANLIQLRGQLNRRINELT